MEQDEQKQIEGSGSLARWCDCWRLCSNCVYYHILCPTSYKNCQWIATTVICTCKHVGHKSSVRSHSSWTCQSTTSFTTPCLLLLGYYKQENMARNKSLLWSSQSTTNMASHTYYTPPLNGFWMEHHKLLGETPPLPQSGYIAKSPQCCCKAQAHM